jgi:hypothetical protein
MKRGQSLDEGEQDLLNQIVQLAARHRVLEEVADKQGSVEICQAAPGSLLPRLGAQKQTVSGNVHCRRIGEYLPRSCVIVLATTILFRICFALL